jgi:hypothetical protein
MKLDRVFVNLKLEQLRVLLVGVARHLEGFADADVEEICGKVANLESDDDVLVEPIVRFQGKSMPLVVNVFGSEAEINEVVFIVPASLADLVQAECRRLVDSGAIRRISAEP